MSKIVVVLFILLPFGCSVFTEELMFGSNVTGNACCRANENNVNSRNGQAESVTSNVSPSPNTSPSPTASPGPSVSPSPSASPKV